MLVIMSLVKVKNEWSCTSPPLLSLCSVEHENFSFLTIICEYFQFCPYAVNMLLCVCVRVYAHAHACLCVCVHVPGP